MKTPNRILAAFGLALLLAAAPSLAQDKNAGFKKIFNGKDLTGWSGNPALWSVDGDSIVGKTTAEKPIKGNTFLIWTNGTTEDFELRLSFKIESGNSGIQYRSKVMDEKNWVVGGYQADLEAGVKYTGILYDEKGGAGGRNIMAERGEKVVWDADCKKQVSGKLADAEKINASIQPGHWSEYRVVVQGNHFQHFINDLQAVDVTDNCESKRVSKGVLALQLHAGPPMTVRFKNIRLKPLAAGKADKADKADKELKDLQGDWEMSAGEVNGVAISSDDISNIIVTIKDDTYKVVNSDEANHGTFSVDPTKSPKEMNVKPATGPDAGQEVPGIYELSGDTFRACYARPGSPRPKTFSTEADSGQMLITYKRKKS
jgi:uncharacterized protein (TIGR03067 family)